MSKGGKPPAKIGLGKPNIPDNITDAVLNEGTWRCFVGVVAGETVYDNEVLPLAFESINSGCRKLFKLIECFSLINEAKEISAKNKKNKGGGKASLFLEVCDQVKDALEHQDSLPPLLLAKLIKFKMLVIKNNDLARRIEEKKLLQQQAKKVETLVVESPQPATKSPVKSATKKGGKKQDEMVAPPSKKSTKMKKRGEEEEKLLTIDDEPDGERDPQHYILLAGFTDAAVIKHLADLGVSVNVMFIVTSDYAMHIQQKQNNTQSEEEAEGNDTERFSADNQSSLDLFWRQADEIVFSAPSGHILKDVGKLPITMTLNSLPSNCLIADLPPEYRVEQGGKLFEVISDCCYDVLELFETYQSYLESINLIDVSQTKPPIEEGEENVEPTTPAVDTRYYEMLMKHVPPQSESVPIILDCLLEQVCCTVENKTIDIADDKPSDNTLVTNYLDQLFVEDETCWAERKCVSCQNEIVYYGDKAKQRIRDVKSDRYFDASESNRRMQDVNYYGNLCAILYDDKHRRMRNFMTWKQLCKTCIEHAPRLTEGKFRRAMQQYFFESKAAKLADRAIQQFMSISQNRPLLSSSRRNSCNLDRYCWLEKMKPSVFYQVVEQRSFWRPFMQKYLNHGNNTLMLTLTTGPHDNTIAWLHSNVGFRNYLDNVRHKIADWIARIEASKEDEAKKHVPDEPDKPKPVCAPLKDGSRFGMKKRSEIETETSDPEADSRKLSPNRATPSLKKKKSATSKSPTAKKSIRNNTPSQRSSRRSVRSKHSFVEEVVVCTPVVCTPVVVEKTYDFTGYNLGDNMLNLTYDRSFVLFDNRSLLQVDSIGFVNGNKITHVKVRTVQEDLFSLSFVNPRKPAANVKELEELEKIAPKQQLCSYSSITAVLSDGMLLTHSAFLPQQFYDRLESYRTLIAESKSVVEELSTPKGSAKGKKGKASPAEDLKKIVDSVKKSEDKKLEAKALLSEMVKDVVSSRNLFLSTPAGLKVSFLHTARADDTVENASFVARFEQKNNEEAVVRTLSDVGKQTESHRSVTQDGVVIKYLTDGAVEAFYPTGHILKSNTESTDWKMIYASGESFSILEDNTRVVLKSLDLVSIKCLESGETLKTREDGLIIVERVDGSCIVEFVDGTRITSNDRNVKIEQTNLPTVIIERTEGITSNFTVKFGNGKSVALSCNGFYKMCEDESIKLQIYAKGNGRIFNSDDEDILFDQTNLDSCVQLNANTISCNAFGEVSKEGGQFSKEASSCYFIVHADGSAEELLCEGDLHPYLDQAEEDPKCAVIKNQVGEDLESVTVIKPLKGADWIPEKEEKCIIPISLRHNNFESNTKHADLKKGGLEEEGCLYEVRHLFKYKPFDDNDRKQVLESIDLYSEFNSQFNQTQCGVDGEDVADKFKNEYLEHMKKKKDSLVDLIPEKTDEVIDQYKTSVRPKSTEKLFNTSKELKEKIKCMQVIETLKKSALDNPKFPPYFQTEEGKSFLYSQGILPDMNELTRDLAIETVRPPPSPSTSVRSPANRQNTENSLEQMVHSVSDATLLLGDQDTSTTQLISPYASYTLHQQRPLNPTPKQAALVDDLIVNRDSKLSTIPEANIKDTQEISDRTSPPSRIKKGTTDMRNVRTASMAGNKTMEERLLLSPDLLDFGILQEGKRYSHAVTLKNVGVLPYRVYVKQPPPSTGLKVIYQPGPIASGMSKKLQVEIVAVAVGVQGCEGVGQVSHKLEISTESEVVYLDIIATIVTNPEACPSKGTVAISDRPVSREDLNRPMK